MPDSRQATVEHQNLVTINISEITGNLNRRARVHDDSKLSPEEKPYFDKISDMSDVEYGSDEYRARLKEAKPGIKHHYEVNDHHPEHYGEEGVYGMSLMAILEMLADWKAASERTKSQPFMQSVEHNITRFDLGGFANILRNTVKELGWE